MAGHKTFGDGEILTATDVNGYLMAQAVIQCTAATRPSSPHAGMTVYETDTDRMMVYNGASWLRYGSQNLVGLKTAGEVVNNSTTLQDDNHITMSVVANATYELQGRFSLTASTAADFKFQFTKPASTTFSISYSSDLGGGVSDLQCLVDTDTNASVLGLGTGTRTSVMLVGCVAVAGTAGSFTLQWAQLAADATDTTLLTGSYVALRRIA